MAKLTKSQILAQLAERTGVSKKAAGQFVAQIDFILEHGAEMVRGGKH